MNQRISSALGLCGFLFLGGLFPAVAAEPPQANSSPALQKLMMMFSPDIKTTLNACREQGGVDLAAGAQADGSVLCANGEPKAAVPYDNYLSTVSDVAAAVGLVGLKTVIAGNPSISPEMMVSFLTSPNGAATLKNAVQTAIARSSLIPIASPESTTLLADQIIGRLVPTLESTNNLTNLVGTTEQYGQVVSNFCSTPGMSITQAQQTIPGLSSVQLYAVCVQESGLADELQQVVNRQG
ncbi:MAG: hypothetical protein KME11_13150 [Timaviella obliquedivisa GSE-PSE-MK23-08B]|jgi:hypothetical protein|nr:hypothetical protein [Timaviella obliquedivisa GSE-PSE-MK23-08B]